MTRYDCKILLPIITAFVEGDIIQMKCGNDWIDKGSDLLFDCPPHTYRIKPAEPKYRPWKPEEVPVGALVRKTMYPNIHKVILESLQDKVFIINCGNLTHLSLQEGNEQWEYSIDQGKTWLPCGVLEK